MSELRSEWVKIAGFEIFDSYSLYSRERSWHYHCRQAFDVCLSLYRFSDLREIEIGVVQ